MSNETAMRTHDCGELGMDDVGEEVSLCGWIRSIRWHGGIVFINLFDRYGATQVVFDEEDFGEDLESVRKLQKQSSIMVKGTVRERPDDQKNSEMSTGGVEVEVEDLTVFNESEPYPFAIDEDIESEEDTRMKWAPLFMRVDEKGDRIEFRSSVTREVIQHLHQEGFTQIETPILAKPTPEGARDFLVPSRLHPGQFYALPQAPQQYKQKLMIAGFDKYFQIARCLRDEDLRADRQPEFTQIDLEMSWIGPEDVYDTVESLVTHLFTELRDVDLSPPFPSMEYNEAMERFGSDKPDLRFGMELVDFTEIFTETEFEVLRNVVDSGGKVLGIHVADSVDTFTRSYQDELDEFVQEHGGAGILVFEMEEDGLSSPVPHLSKEEEEDVVETADAETDDVILMVAGESGTTHEIVGEVRLKVASDLERVDAEDFSPLWITDFPLFEYSEEEDRWVSVHHPFTKPADEFIEPLMDVDSLDELEEEHGISPDEIKAETYDFVLDGWEIGGGSIRIHDPELQEHIFQLLEMPEEEYQRKFGSLLEFLEYGAPPHGGIALGLDRLVSILAGVSSIRDVIPFPKNQNAVCLMDDSPSEVSEEQLRELHLRLRDED